MVTFLVSGISRADRDVASDEADPGQLLGPLVEALEVLAVGADVVVEDRRLGVGVVVLRQDHLLLGVRAADRRAVGVAARDDLPGADAVDPGDLVRMLACPTAAGSRPRTARWSTAAARSRGWSRRSPSCRSRSRPAPWGRTPRSPGDRTIAPTLISTFSAFWLRSMASFLQTPSQMSHFLSFR